MSIEIELNGIDEIVSKLESLGRKAKSVEDKALTMGGQIILDEAISNLSKTVNEDTGRIRAGLKVSKIKGVTGKRYVLVGIEKDDTSEIFYAKFLEWGAVPHKIKIKRGRYSGRVINHPGVSARAFLGSAYVSKKDMAKQAIVNEFKQALGL